MSTNPQLPDDFVEGYWEVVVEDLVELGLSQVDATAAAAGFRAYMKPAEWAVYNRPTAESAELAQLWLKNYGQAGKARTAQPTPANGYSPEKKPRRRQRLKPKVKPEKTLLNDSTPPSPITKAGGVAGIESSKPRHARGE
jgi:hypothetical protein